MIVFKRKQYRYIKETPTHPRVRISVSGDRGQICCDWYNRCVFGGFKFYHDEFLSPEKVVYSIICDFACRRNIPRNHYLFIGGPLNGKLIKHSDDTYYAYGTKYIKRCYYVGEKFIYVFGPEDVSDDDLTRELETIYEPCKTC